MPRGDEDEIVARCEPLLVFAELLFGKRLPVELLTGERFFGELLAGRTFLESRTFIRLSS
jgi:hypothetical protein